jgi:hypothetical protein
MAHDYNFLGLVNDIANKFNEVELTSSNFDSALGVYSDFKNAVNVALNDISQDPTRWPYTHVTQNLVLTPLQVRYTIPDDVKLINYDTFRIQGDSGFNITTRYLYPIEYEDYLMHYSDYEYRPENYEDVPAVVSHTIGREFVIVPPAKMAYTLSYEAHKIVEPLVLWDDIPVFPIDFKWAIFQGALIYAYDFRGDVEMSQKQELKFKAALDKLRISYNNRTKNIRSPMLVRP